MPYSLYTPKGAGILERYDLSDPEEIKWLFEDAKEIRDYAQRIYTYLEEEGAKAAIKLNRCPECLEELELRRVGGERHEVWGATVTEPEYRLHCTACWWSE